mmetsp:Transcript_15147/g.31463  ORF Transcript_15147/g.31463 Transcript_15147/m.31463 type:complete len:267 (-) Transcript_15147:278-1078(-)
MYPCLFFPSSVSVYSTTANFFPLPWQLSTKPSQSARLAPSGSGELVSVKSAPVPWKISPFRPPFSFPSIASPGMCTPTLGLGPLLRLPNSEEAAPAPPWLSMVHEPHLSLCFLFWNLKSTRLLRRSWVGAFLPSPAVLPSFMWCRSDDTTFFTPSFSTRATSAMRFVRAREQQMILSQSRVASKVSLRLAMSPLMSSTAGGMFSSTSSEMERTMARTVYPRSSSLFSTTRPTWPVAPITSTRVSAACGTNPKPSSAVSPKSSMSSL